MLGIAAIAVAFGGSPPPAPLHPLEQAVLASREAIQDAHLVIEVDTLDRRYAPHPLRYRYETWYERTGDRQRTDITPLDETTRATRGQIPNPFLICHNCPERGKLLGLCRRLSAVKITPLDIPHPAGADDSRRVDVTMLGMVYSKLWDLGSYRAADKVGLSRQPEFRQTEERLGGRRVVRHTASPRPGNTHSIWIDPDRGPAVVRVEYTGPRPGKPDFRSVMEVVPAQDPVSSAWYFNSYIMNSVFSDENDVRETATVTTMEVNRGIDPAVYTWAGLNIDSGTPFMRYADHDTIAFDGWWDGTREVSDKEFKKRPEYQAALQAAVPPEPVGAVPDSGPSVWQYVLAAVLGAAGLFAVVRAVR